MDDLDAQLAQLQLMNSRDLSPKPLGPIVKKVGPAVPPKPAKKSNQNQSQPNVHHNDYSNMKLTLDNPAILEQKLEALEHHKRVLENQQQRRQQLRQKPTGTGMIGLTAQMTAAPATKILSTPYENVRPKDGTDLLYTNVTVDKQALPPPPPSLLNHSHPYSNIRYESHSDILPPPPPIDMGGGSNLSSVPLTISTDLDSGGVDEELPPPPSPVSSSYSELRRATDNSYPSMGVYSGTVPNQSIDGAYQPLQSKPIIGDTVIGPTDLPPQQYGNNYHPDYGTYVPSSQSFNSDYYNFGTDQSHDSSTYESIYEPINPRPNSQLSSRSNYSLYTSYGSGQPPPQPTAPDQSTSGFKEAEVDALTNLLVQSMDGGVPDVDSYGICVQCGERVLGENSGCTAMEQIFHIACFTCCQCQINLQGKPFYALDGKPCCEEDYLNTLEKCSVCMKPILERILRATGKPYHPGCFCCVVCKKSLDGVPFTVDATNQNHCIEDFHKKFAPRCCLCRQPIMPEPGKEETVRVVALDRSFHVSCYKCEDCGLLLSSEAEGRGCFPLDDHILCKSCNAKRVQALTSRMTTEL